MKNIILNSQMVKILNPLRLDEFSNQYDLYQRANKFCSSWIRYGLCNDMTINQLTKPFGIIPKDESIEKLHALMASSWVDLYLDKRELEIVEVQ